MEQTPEEAVLAANDAFYRAFESLDLQRMDAVWDHDSMVRCVHPGWGLLKGRDAVMASWQRLFENAAMMQFSIAGVEATVAGEWAFVHCTEHLSQLVGDRVASAVVQSVNVFRQRGNHWLLVHHHGSQVVA